jgi:hypothetical protein
MTRQIAAAIKAEKQRSWEKATVSLDGLQGRRLWSKLKTLTGTHRSSTARVRVKDVNNAVTTNRAETANDFACHLARVHKTHEGPEFDRSFRTATEKSVKDRAIEYRPNFKLMPESGDDSPLIAEIRPPEIRATLLTWKAHSAPGEDGVNYVMLKNLPGKMLLILSLLYTICLLAGYFLRCWKLAVGIVLPKSDKDK